MNHRIIGFRLFLTPSTAAACINYVNVDFGCIYVFQQYAVIINVDDELFFPDWT